MITTEHKVLALALAFHREVEGEYGCPGATCPGVQRLVAHFTAAKGIGIAEWVPGHLKAGRLWLLMYSVDYDGDCVASIHASYAGALRAAGRAMTRPDHQDPYGIATRTDFQRMPVYADALDRWRNKTGSCEYEIVTEDLQP